MSRRWRCRDGVDDGYSHRAYRGSTISSAGSTKAVAAPMDVDPTQVALVELPVQLPQHLGTRSWAVGAGHLISAPSQPDTCRRTAPVVPADPHPLLLTTRRSGPTLRPLTGPRGHRQLHIVLLHLGDITSVDVPSTWRTGEHGTPVSAAVRSRSAAASTRPELISPPRPARTSGSDPGCAPFRPALAIAVRSAPSSPSACSGRWRWCPRPAAGRW